VLKEFADAYRKAERYWNKCAEGAKKILDQALKQLDEVVEKEVISAVMVSNKDELVRLHKKLNRNMVLTEDYDGSEMVPKGRKLFLDQGDVSEIFNGKNFHYIHTQFVKELSKKITKQRALRLLFTSNVDDTKGKKIETQAMKEFEKMMRAVKKASVCFPETVKVKLDSLSDKLNDSKLRMKDQFAKQKLHIQEEELKKAMEFAELKLQQAESKMQAVEEQNGVLKDEKTRIEHANDGLRTRAATVEAKLVKSFHQQKAKMQADFEAERRKTAEEYEAQRKKTEEEYENTRKEMAEDLEKVIRFSEIEQELEELKKAKSEADQEHRTLLEQVEELQGNKDTQQTSGQEE